jgi:hypothetical protein
MFLKEFEMITLNGNTYDDRHGGAFDRGSADSYYGRSWNPHYFKGNSYSSEEVKLENMTPAEIADYTAGYNYNEECGFKKEW